MKNSYYEKLREQSAELSAFGQTIAGLCQNDYDNSEKLKEEYDKLNDFIRNLRENINNL